MVVFRAEWKRSRRYIGIWAVAIAVSVFVMTPVYYAMIGAADSLPASFAQGGFFETLGVSLALLQEPLGMYAFLNAFYMIAGGIFGMHLGLSLYTKECTERTAEYLFTKPCGRVMIYRGKTLCALGGVGVVGVAYFAGSLLTLSLFRPGFSLREFCLYAGAFVLVTLFFCGLGLLWGCVKPNNQSPLLTAGLVVFLEYCIAAFAQTIENNFLTLLSPFSFFKPAPIHELGFYSLDYLLWYLLLVALFFVLSHRTLQKRDVSLIG